MEFRQAQVPGCEVLSLMSRCEGWCGECYANKKKRGNYKGHRGYVAPRPLPVFYGSLVMYAKRVNGSAGSSGGGSFADAASESRWPALVDYLLREKWEDGKERIPSNLLLFIQDGRWKGCVTDKANGRVAFFTAATLQELLETVEAGLSGEAADWRKQKPYGAKK